MFVGCGGGALTPQFAPTVTMPLAVVIDEFVYILGLREAAEEQVLKDRVVQHHDAGTREGLAIDRAMELVVADVVQVHIGLLEIGTDVAELLQRAEQGRGIIRDAGASGW